VRVEAGDDERRERLVRYCARPPFALERIELMKDGRVAYRLKTPRRGKTHRVMTPVEFLGRLAILVPPPYFPLVRYHGVFAARSSWRALVTPKPPDGVARRKKRSRACSDDPQASAPSAAPAPVPGRFTPQPGANDGAATTPARAPVPDAAADAASAMAKPAATPGAPDLRAVAVASDDPTIISIEHWRRLLDGELYAASSRIEWALLLRRTYGVDALRCPKCAGRMRVMATLVEPGVVKKILAHLGLPTEPLPRARARDPTGQQSFDFDAA
jgi:Putative transposase